MNNRHFMDLRVKLAERKAVAGVIGLGYVGLPLAVTAAKRGLRTIGFDIDTGKMNLLAAGKSYIEAVTPADLAAVSTSGRLTWTTDFSVLRECDAIAICVPTPLTRHREPDLSFIVNTCEAIRHALRPGMLVVLESTTFPGTVREVMTPILAKSGLEPGRDFFVAFSPEREDPGNATFRTATIPKIVGGDGPEARELVELFYSAIVEKVVPVSTTATAEAVKITENIFRAVNIALVNELKIIYDRMGIDVWEVIDGAATKPFGFMPFYPGPGLGGHCIPIDPFYLTWKAREYELTTRFIELAGEINVTMPNYVVAKLRTVLDTKKRMGLTGARVLVVGIAYKKNVSDMRESPAARLMELLIEQGALVEYIDPHVPQVPRMREYPDLVGKRSLAPEAVTQGMFDAVLIATDHDVIDYEALVNLGIPVVDTRNAIARRHLPMDNVTKS